MFSLSPLIATYWHQKELSGCSVYAEANKLFKQQISTYLAIMLQVSWHIIEGNEE